MKVGNERRLDVCIVIRQINHIVLDKIYKNENGFHIIILSINDMYYSLY